MQQQRNISQAIIEAEEKERNRLGAELHDNINQLLVCARLYLGMERKKQTEVSEFLVSADEQLSLAIEEIRKLTHRLTNAFIASEGLQKCVDEIGKYMWQVKSIRLKINISEAIISKLSQEIQLTLYRIIQEQTNNILKYSETKTAAIRLREKSTHLELIISDSGKGFDKTEQKLTGIGFSNIFNRVNAYDGKMEIISSPGKGCKLVVRIPISE